MASAQPKRVTRLNLEHYLGNPPSSQDLTQPAQPQSDTFPKRLQKKQTLDTINEDQKTIRRQPRELALPRFNKLAIRDESPWDTFKKVYDCDLAGSLSVVIRRSNPTRAQAIRKFAFKDADDILQLFQSIQHENLASPIECFKESDIFFTLSEFYPLTLEHIVACKAFPDERQLAMIMTQLLSGLSYLARQGLRHNCLDCSSILLDLDGRIKIAHLESCYKDNSRETTKANLTAISNLMMNLMQKYVKEDGVVGVDNIEQWPFDSAAVGFLSSTTSARSIEELRKHDFISNLRYCKGDLVGLAWFTLISTRTFYSYTPRESD